MVERKTELTEEGQARRRFLKQAGAVAWASPFIVTMMSRATAHAQQNCGTTALAADPPFALFCNVTQPCGTAIPCVPAPGANGTGDPCICASP